MRKVQKRSGWCCDTDASNRIGCPQLEMILYCFGSLIDVHNTMTCVVRIFGLEIRSPQYEAR